MRRRRSRGRVARAQLSKEAVRILDAQECALGSPSNPEGPRSVRLPFSERLRSERGVAREVVERVGGVDVPGETEEGVVLEVLSYRW